MAAGREFRSVDVDRPMGADTPLVVAIPINAFAA
jgi:hypothetical protein